MNIGYILILISKLTIKIFHVLIKIKIKEKIFKKNQKTLN